MDKFTLDNLIKTHTITTNLQSNSTYTNHKFILVGDYMSGKTTLLSNLHINPPIYQPITSTIQPTEYNIQTTTITDLPGLITYPPQKTQELKEMYDKYLLQDNITIICTYPAGQPSIYSSPTISYILNNNLSFKTILVVTMMDIIILDYYKNTNLPFLNVIKSDQLGQKLIEIQHNYIKTAWSSIILADISNKIKKTHDKIKALKPLKIKSEEFINDLKQSSQIILNSEDIIKNVVNEENKCDCDKHYGLKRIVKSMRDGSDYHKLADIVCNMIDNLALKIESIKKKIKDCILFAIEELDRNIQYFEGVQVVVNHVDTYDFTTCFQFLQDAMYQFISEAAVNMDIINTCCLVVKMKMMFNILVVKQFVDSLHDIKIEEELVAGNEYSMEHIDLVMQKGEYWCDYKYILDVYRDIIIQQ
jgi:hypothetical protein